MPYIGSRPPPSALTSSDIADSIITEAKMADDAISLAELKAGTDGQIISWDASGNPVAIAVGTSGHFLKSQGAGSQPVFAAAAGGKVGQCLSVLDAGTASTTSSSFVALGSTLTLNITPVATSSKVLLMACLPCVSNGTAGEVVAIAFNGGNAATYMATDATGIEGGSGMHTIQANNGTMGAHAMYLDSPSTTSQITYAVHWRIGLGGTAYNGRPKNLGGGQGNFASTFTVMEILA